MYSNIYMCWLSIKIEYTAFENKSLSMYMFQEKFKIISRQKMTIYGRQKIKKKNTAKPKA